MKVNFDAVKIQQAIQAIEAGWTKRVDIDDHTKVYEVKNVIRIDLKSTEQ